MARKQKTPEQILAEKEKKYLEKQQKKEAKELQKLQQKELDAKYEQEQIETSKRLGKDYYIYNLVRENKLYASEQDIGKIWDQFKFNHTYDIEENTIVNRSVYATLLSKKLQEVGFVCNYNTSNDEIVITDKFTNEKFKETFGEITRHLNNLEQEGDELNFGIIPTKIQCERLKEVLTTQSSNGKVGKKIQSEFMLASLIKEYNAFDDYVEVPFSSLLDGNLLLDKDKERMIIDTRRQIRKLDSSDKDKRELVKTVKNITYSTFYCISNSSDVLNNRNVLDALDHLAKSSNTKLMISYEESDMTNFVTIPKLNVYDKDNRCIYSGTSIVKCTNNLLENYIRETRFAFKKVDEKTPQHELENIYVELLHCSYISESMSTIEEYFKLFDNDSYEMLENFTEFRKKINKDLLKTSQKLEDKLQESELDFFYDIQDMFDEKIENEKINYNDLITEILKEADFHIGKEEKTEKNSVLEFKERDF